MFQMLINTYILFKCKIMNISPWNSVKLILCFFRKILNWFRARSAKKAEQDAAEENLYTRWEQDKDLQAYPEMGLFPEFLEMGTNFY